MPLEVDRTPRSERDAFDIWDYVSLDSALGAERLLRRIDAIVQMLAERPAAGRARTELGHGIRSFPAESYMVYYRYSETTLTVVRILHAARDVTPDMLGG